jgi:tetratricopeptide (TPR) repeat protein
MFRLDNRIRGRSITGIVLLMLAPALSVKPRSSAKDQLQEAKRLVWLNNWSEAARVLKGFKPSDLNAAAKADVLFARAVHIRGNIESMTLPAAANEVASMLKSREARMDSELRLDLLSIKGDIEFQYNLPASQETWEEASRTASAAGKSLWKSRAEGELGTIAFLNGEVFKATKLVTGAVLKAEIAGDVAAQIRYRTALGEGFAEYGRAADAIRFFEKALALSAATPGAYFPFTAYLGKARCWSKADDLMKASATFVTNWISLAKRILRCARRVP